MRKLLLSAAALVALVSPALADYRPTGAGSSVIVISDDASLTDGCAARGECAESPAPLDDDASPDWLPPQSDTLLSACLSTHSIQGALDSLRRVSFAQLGYEQAMCRQSFQHRRDMAIRAHDLEVAADMRAFRKAQAARAKADRAKK